MMEALTDDSRTDTQNFGELTSSPLFVAGHKKINSLQVWK